MYRSLIVEGAAEVVVALVDASPFVRSILLVLSECTPVARHHPLPQCLWPDHRTFGPVLHDVHQQLAVVDAGDLEFGAAVVEEFALLLWMPALGGDPAGALGV